MTRKDYRAIAGAIRTERDEARRTLRSVHGRGDTVAETFGGGVLYGSTGVINALCEVLRYDNPRFDAAKFREACYGEEK